MPVELLNIFPHCWGDADALPISRTCSARWIIASENRVNCCQDVLLVHLRVSGTADAVQVCYSHVDLTQEQTRTEQSLVFLQELFDLLSGVINGMNDNIGSFIISVVREDVQCQRSVRE